jgi:hypothetical protein
MPFVPTAPLAWRLFRSLVRTHVEFFSRSEAPPGTDVLKLNNLPAPVPGVENTALPTVVIDLTLPEEVLWNGMDAKTRKVIRQAARENIEVRELRELSADDWQAFLEAYDKLRSRKRQIDPLGLGQIHELIGKGWFAATACRGADGALLSWHNYVRRNGRVRLLNTVSALDPARDTQWNNMVGRAHRLHHWKDMLAFKAQGVATYDLGGVYRGTDDQEQINIARFKTSFGGAPADTFDAALPLTVKGRLALSLRSVARSLAA